MQFAPLYPLLHRVLKPRFPDCLWAGCQETPKIALTFDDGPSPQHTFALLEVLERHRIPASFFWLGVCVDRSPQLAQFIYEQGHWIGLHGYDHRSFAAMQPSKLKQELEKTKRAITQACQISSDKLIDVRPPNGLFTPHTIRLLNQWGYRPVMWSVVPEDWVHPGVSIVVQRVLAQVQNGSVIVLHDGCFGGRDVAETVDRLIPALIDRGYQFASINDLWSSPNIDPNHPA
ncbi:polysaccharide deacetylase family protein [Phormidesmis priestleyi]